jgi:hypothetical protein
MNNSKRNRKGQMGIRNHSPLLIGGVSWFRRAVNFISKVRVISNKGSGRCVDDIYHVHSQGLLPVEMRKKLLCNATQETG